VVWPEDLLTFHFLSVRGGLLHLERLPHGDLRRIGIVWEVGAHDLAGPHPGGITVSYGCFLGFGCPPNDTTTLIATTRARNERARVGN
jgi:hypothetical protein